MHLQIVVLRDGLSDCSSDFFDVGALLPAFDLLHHDEQFPVAHLDRERRAAIRSEHWMTFSYRLFDILRVMVPTPDDDQVFESTGNEEFAVLHKSKIAGPKKWPRPCPCDPRPKGLFGFPGSVPITFGGTRTCKPDLAHYVGGALSACGRIHDHDFRVSNRTTATYNSASPLGTELTDLHDAFVQRILERKHMRREK